MGGGVEGWARRGARSLLQLTTERTSAVRSNAYGGTPDGSGLPAMAVSYTRSEWPSCNRMGVRSQPVRGWRLQPYVVKAPSVYVVGSLLVSYTGKQRGDTMAILAKAHLLEIDGHLTGVSEGRTHAKGPVRVDLGPDVPKVGA